jgi:lipase maturation factor 1
MLLSAGFCSLFFAPRGARPGLGLDDPPPPLARLALVWLWFCIYFGSGVVKLLSHDEQWRNLTAMDHYYENGPLPSFLGWYVQQWMPKTFHTFTAFSTLALELVVCWLAFLPPRFRRALFWIVTPFQLGIIVTSNYAFLNWLVLSLGFLLLDDAHLARFGLRLPEHVFRPPVVARAQWATVLSVACLAVYFYVSGLELFGRFLPLRFLPTFPVEALQPFRIANSYGLFAVMTPARYEIEFQGSNDDGATWVAYQFRYKPQALDAGGGIYAPYQPRFEWNLWFASLNSPQRYPWVKAAAEALLAGSPDVLALFREDPFHGTPPRQIRAVRWQYWYTTPEQKQATGNYWRREERDLYVPPLRRD